YVAFAMFRHAPRYFRGLVLADTRPQADSPEGVQARKHLLAWLQKSGPSAVADEMMPKLVGDTTRQDRPAVVDHVRSLALSNSVDGLAGAICALMHRPDSTGLLASIHCPTLVLVGDEDVITPVALAEKMAEAIAGSEVVTVARAGHLANLERPDLFNAAVAHF